MSLAIGRLRNRFRSDAPLPRAQCAGWLQALAAADGDALSADLTGPDEWLLIRHLPIELRWRQDASEADVTQHWSQALRHALAQAATSPESHALVRYTSRRSAIADMLYRSALGETARQWAWVQMALIPHAGLSPAEVVRQTIVLLQRERELAWPVLHRLVTAEARNASLTALLRGLSATDWQDLLSASARSAGFASLLNQPAPVPTDETTRQIRSVQPDLPGQGLATSTEAQTLLGWIEARKHFAARHVDILSVLIASLAGSAAGASEARRAAQLHAVRMRLRALLGSTPRSPAPPAQPPASTQPPHMPAASHVPAEHEDDLPPLPALAENAEWLPTQHAGALFWLARIPASGVLEWLQTESPDAALPQMLYAIALALGVPPDDAAMRAFCAGEIPAEPPETRAPALADYAITLVGSWQAWLDENAPELTPPRIAAVCDRTGRLRFEAGWIELHLPLDSVDTSIRRLGLDLDPGWLPWLGCVVRICYDE